MAGKFVWKIHTIRENAHLTRVVPINNLCNCVGKPARIVRKLFLFAVDWFFILPIQEADECRLDLWIVKCDRIETQLVERAAPHPWILRTELSEEVRRVGTRDRGQ